MRRHAYDQKPVRKGRHYITWPFLLLNVLAAVSLIFSYAAFHIRPSLIPFMAFAGLAYPYILLANLFFVLFWILSRTRYALISLVLILAGWNHLGRLIQLDGNDIENKPEGYFKVLSYNLQNFLKVNTSSTKYVTDFENEAMIIKFLKEQDADIVCLQEMLHDREDISKYLEDMSATLGCPNYHHLNYFARNKEKLDAIATFTRYPILDKGNLNFEDKSIGIFTDLVIGKDTLRVYNLHLASIHFKREDYLFWKEIGNQQESDQFASGTGKIMAKMKTAFIKREQQTDVLLDHMAGSPFPVMICGDFNDTPSSFTYNCLSTNRKDAFVESGSGLGITYAGEFFPAFRIDFILFDAVYHSIGFERHKVSFSDHFPISAYLKHD